MDQMEVVEENRLQSEMFEKLNHRLSSIRNRALDSLCFKLDHNLLGPGHLSQNKKFISALVDWINSYDNRDEIKAHQLLCVLKLIDQLGRYQHANHSLRQFGIGSAIQNLFKCIRREHREASITKLADKLNAFFNTHPTGLSSRAVMDELSTKDTEFLTHHSNTNQEKRDRNSQYIESTVHQSTYFKPTKSMMVNNSAWRGHSDSKGNVHNLNGNNDQISSTKADSNMNNMIPLNFLFLSAKDESFVADFSLILNSVTSSGDTSAAIPFEKILLGFDILCFDFGPQIFLQRTELLSSIIEGCFSDTYQHQENCVAMLEKLSSHWTGLLKQSLHVCQSFRTTNQKAPMISHNTPEISNQEGFSRTIGNNHFQSSLPNPLAKSSNDGNYYQKGFRTNPSLSLIQGSYEVAARISPLLKDKKFALSAIRVIQNLLPYIQIYLETIAYDLESNFTFIERYSEYCQYFIGIFLEAIDYINGANDADVENPEDSVLLNTIYRFIGTVVISLVPEELQQNYPQILASVLIFVSANRKSNVAYSCCRESLKHKDNSGILKFFLTFAQNYIRYDALRAINDAEFSRNEQICNFNDSDFWFLLLNIVATDSDVAIRELAIEVSLKALDCCNDLTTLTQIACLGQSLGKSDEGKIMAKALNLMEQKVTDCSILVFSMRGLLSKDIGIRNLAYSKLRRHAQLSNESYSFILDGPNSLVFDKLPEIKVEDEISECKKTHESSHYSLIVLERQIMEDYVDAAESLCYFMNDKKEKKLLLQSGVGEVAAIALIHAFKANHGNQYFYTMYRLLLVIESASISDHSLVKLAYGNLEFTRTLAKLSQSNERTMRLQVAKTICSLYLPFHNSKSMSKTSLSSVEQMKIPKFVADTHNIAKPFVKLNEFDYNSLNLDENDGKFLLRAIKLRSGEFFSLNPINTLTLIQELGRSRNHYDFRKNLNVIKSYCYSDNDLRYLPFKNTFPVFAKFLNIPPASSSDCQLLKEILSFVSSILPHQNLCNGLFEQILECLKQNILELIVSNPVLEKGNPLAISLAAEAVKFVSIFLDQCSNAKIEKIVRQTTVIRTMKLHHITCFSCQQKSTYDFQNRFYTMEILSKLCKIKNIVSCVGVELYSNLISLFSHTLGCILENLRFQEFSHQDRTTLRMTIQNIEAVLSVVISCGKNIKQQLLKPEFWFIDSSLDWIMALLADDEVFVQEKALRLISDFILHPTSEGWINDNIPSYMEMAISFSLDPEKPDSVRKESLRIISNALRSEFTDTKAQLTMLENSLFYEQLNEFFIGNWFALSYPEEITLVMLVLCQLDDGLLRKKFKNLTLWHDYLKIICDVDQIQVALYEDFGLDKRPFALQSLRFRGFLDVMYPSILAAQMTAIDFILLMANTDEDTQRIISSDERFISSIFNIMKRIMSTGSIVTKKGLRVIERLPKLLGLILPWLCSQSMTNLPEIVNQLSWSDWFVVLVDLYSRRSISESSFLSYLAKILGLAAFMPEYKIQLCAHLETALDNNVIVADVLVFTLAKMLHEKLTTAETNPDWEFTQCLQLLSLSIELVPQSATRIPENLIPIILKRAEKIYPDTLLSAKSWDYRKSFQIYSCYSLCLRLSRGYEQDQLIHASLFHLLTHIFVIKQLRHEYSLSFSSYIVTLLCKFLVSSNSEKRLLLAIKTLQVKNPKNSIYLLARILSFSAVKLPNTERLYSLCIDVLKEIMAVDTIRSYCAKTEFFQSIYPILSNFYKAKDEFKCGKTLELLVSVARMKNNAKMFDLHRILHETRWLIEAYCPNSHSVTVNILILMRNLMTTREAKGILINDKYFMSGLQSIVGSTEDLYSANAACSLLLVLTHDNLKSIPILRRMDILKDLQAAMLRSEFQIIDADLSSEFQRNLSTFEQVINSSKS